MCVRSRQSADLPRKKSLVQISRILRRRVRVLRLGSRGPGGDQRYCFVFAIAASVRECRARFAVENGREIQNCRHFLDLASQKCQQSQGWKGSWSATRNGRHFWTCVWSSRFKSVNSHRDRGALLAKCRTVVTFGLANGPRISKVSTVAGMVGVLVAQRRTMVTFGLAFGPRVSKVSTVTEIGGGLGREMQKCRHF